MSVYGFAFGCFCFECAQKSEFPFLCYSMRVHARPIAGALTYARIRTWIYSACVCARARVPNGNRAHGRVVRATCICSLVHTHTHTHACMHTHTGSSHSTRHTSASSPPAPALSAFHCGVLFCQMHYTPAVYLQFYIVCFVHQRSRQCVRVFFFVMCLFSCTLPGCAQCL